MPPSSSTRTQLAARYSRLVRKIEIVPVPEGMSRILVENAGSILQLFPLSTTDQEQTFLTPDCDDVLSAMKDMMPSPSDSFTPDVFKGPLFPIAVLHDVAALYGCQPDPTDFKDALDLSELEQSNNSITTIVWFCFVLDCNIATAAQVLCMFKAPRRIARSGEVAAPVRVSVHRQGAQQTLNVSPAEGNATRGPPPVENGNDRNGNLPDLPSHDSGNENEQAVEAPVQSPDAHTTEPVPSSSMPSGPGLHGNEDIRKSSYVHQHFKNRKFNGEIEQSIELFLRDYKVALDSSS